MTSPSVTRFHSQRITPALKRSRSEELGSEKPLDRDKSLLETLGKSFLSVVAFSLFRLDLSITGFYLFIF